MFRYIVFAGLAVVLSAPAAAQTRSVSGDGPKPQSAKKQKLKQQQKKSAVRQRAYAAQSYGFFNSWFDDDDDDDYSYNRPQARRVPTGPKLADGGGRPSITPALPSVVSYSTAQAPGTIVIDTSARRLYLVQGGSKALSYPVSVGREGFSWTGTEKITRVANWPDWHPPAEMRQRDPRLPEKMTGGVRNPLGAKALYLGNTLYRIHGTSDAKSIGRAASSGCFRMHNKHVVDLAGRVGVGTKVVVIRGSGATRTAQY
jgi:lipoprotein-anchoring transpeptidase ErfK/SrfK